MLHWKMLYMKTQLSETQMAYLITVKNEETELMLYCHSGEHDTLDNFSDKKGSKII